MWPVPPGPRIASASIAEPGNDFIAASALFAIAPALRASTSAKRTLAGVGVGRGADDTKVISDGFGPMRETGVVMGELLDERPSAAAPGSC
jgi:hypothetical protein